MLKTFVKIAISALLIWWLVSHADVEQVLGHMAASDPWGVGLAVAILTVLAACQAARWQLVIRAIGQAMKYADALKNVLIGIFFNQLLPSSIGGDAVRIWRAYRLGLGLVPAAHSVMLDRLTALLALVLMAGAGIPLIFALLGDSPQRWGVPVMVVAGLCGFAALLSFDRMPGAFMNWRPLKALAALSADGRRVLLNPVSTPMVLALSLFIHSGVALSVFVIAQAMGIEVRALDCLVLVPPVILFSMVPISIAGWGVREGAMVTAFAFVGVERDPALALSVMFGLAIMASGIPGGVIWLLKGSRRAQELAEAEAVTETLKQDEPSPVER